MHVRTLISPFLVSLVLGVLVVLVPIYASAACCGCGMCWMKYYTYPPCSCPGEGGCGWCSTDGFDAFQFDFLTDKDTTNKNSILEDLTPIVAKSDVTKGVMALMSGGKCLHDKMPLSLLGNAREGLKFTPSHFNEKNMVSFLIDADNER